MPVANFKIQLGVPGRTLRTAGEKGHWRENVAKGI